VFDFVERLFRGIAPDPSDGFFSLRLVRECSERWRIRQGVVLPVERSEDMGAMVMAFCQGGIGYAATSDLSERALEQTVSRARFHRGLQLSEHARTRDAAPARGLPFTGSKILASASPDRQNTNFNRGKRAASRQ
jgi:predicted Zn-dependent protease